MSSKSKWKTYYEGSRKYLTVWERDFPWVSKASDGSDNAYCKMCHKLVSPRKAALAQHAATQEHRNRVQAAGSTSKMALYTSKATKASTDLKRIELELAAAVCCHCSINIIDHLSELIKKNAKGNVMENIKLHRTKCSKLILNVIAPALKERLIQDVQGKNFSVLIDEATDISIAKNMCICIRYFSSTTEEIETAFVGLISVVEATGEVLFQALKNCLTGIGLSLTKCIGFGSDGAANMIGGKNSVWSRIHAESPHCVQFRCICHSLALCVQKSFEKLPSHLGYLLAEIPTWFSKSTLRREEYKRLFQELNSQDEQRRQTGLPFQRMSATRWLVRGRVLANILANWEELKVYFLSASQSGTQEVRYKGRQILDMLRDDVNFLFFVFLVPVVQEFEKVNALFQSTNADPEKMVKELDLHHRSLKKRLYDIRGNELALSLVDFGASLHSELLRCVRENKERQDFEVAVSNMKLRCQDFLKDLLTQLEQRLPASTAIFRGLSYLSPSVVLSQTARIPLSQLPLQHLLTANVNLIESQYRKVVLQIWREEPVFEGTLPTDSVKFWAGILRYKNGLDEYAYKELAMYALTCLCSPVSNAIVERMFSHVTCIKTKYRNKLSLKMLDALIRIRTHLIMHKMCCKDFVVTENMLQKFNTAEMYCDSNDQADDLPFEDFE